MLSPLRRKRILSEKSIYDIGKRTGIDTAKISLIERGYKTARPDEKNFFALALECTVKELFPEETS